MKTAQVLFLTFLMTFLLSFSMQASSKIIKMNAEAGYVMIPVEDNAPNFPFSIVSEKGERSHVSYIRIARDTINYWVKYPIEQYKGQNINLHFEGDNLPSMGLESIYQGDSLPFDYNEKYRPAFHFSSEIGWINDPNGMVYNEGVYHLFYQHNPYGTKWGNMHWGHAVSKDLLSWKSLGNPIAPDANGDIFSGSAVIDINNTAGFGKGAMVAIYTSAGQSQSQSIAYSTDNGMTFQKFAGNPVIKNPGIPDFRDPKVSWNEEMSKWVMALATRQTISFYSSSNLKDWEKLSEFGDGIGSHGGVWECPDLFPLEYNGKKKWVLIVSINPGGPNNGSATQYFIGEFNGKEFKADNLPYPLWIDYGQDNYAGVTWNNMPATDNRRIFLGWMANWNYANDVPTKNFRNAMTLPRELFLKNNGNHLILASRPVTEFNSIEKEWIVNKEIATSDSLAMPGILDGLHGTFSLEMDIIPGIATKFAFNLYNAKKEALCINFNLDNQYISVDRKNSGRINFNPAFINVSGAPLSICKEYHLKLIMDNASSELFINDGELVLTHTFFPIEDMNSISFSSQNGSVQVRNIIINKITK